MNITPVPKKDLMLQRKDALQHDASMAVYTAYNSSTSKNLFMKSSLLKTCVFVIALLITNLFFTQDSFAQGTMGRWEMCGLSGTTAGSVSPTGVLSNVTFSPLSRGAGLTAASATNGYSSSGFSTASTLDITQNDYYEFTITPAPGYKMSITALKIRDVVSTTSSTFDAYVRYSDDAYGSTLSTWQPGTTAANHTVTLSGNAALQNRTTAVTFRIYGSDAAASGTTYRLDCLSTGFRGVDVDGTVAQIAYASQLVSINTGATTWCAGETRNVTVQIKNVGSAAWTDGGGNDFNIGVKWGVPNTCTSTGNWCDYHIRQDAQNLAPGATGTYTFSLKATNNTGGAYTTDLAAGSYPISFDIVFEGVTWFGNNGGSGINTVGPGNIAFTTAAQTVVANGTLGLTSAVGTDAQTKCISTAITNITYLVGGTSTGASATGLPTGVTGAYNSGTKVFTISGTPTVSGVFNYTVNTSGSACTNPSLSGTITVNANSTLSLSSAVGTNAQTICITNPLTTITYAVGGGATGASITAGALPAGVTGSYSAGVFTISGTPTATGAFSYTVTTTGPCTNPSLSGTITVNANSTLSLSSAVGTNAQTVCQNTAITNITYAGGGGITGASITAGALPAGVTGSYNAGTKVFTITGTPTAFGSFSYTVTTAGPCNNVSLSGTIDVTQASSLSLVTAGTNTQTICTGSSIVDINYTYGGTATGASITAGALPAGVISGDDGGGNFVITGTPTVTGTFNYTVTTAGPCPVSLTGTITINANSTLTFTSAVGTDAQTKCINTAITNITYLVGAGGTSASITAGALPAGVTGTYNSGTKVFTISGTPTAAGTFNYTVGTAGPCVNTSLSGTITVTPNSTITLTSAVGTNAQTKCINNAITDITYSVGGSATAASITAGALPAGVTGSFSAGVFTITGTPTASGSFSYTITATGPCANATASGTITVNANSTLTFTSAVGTDAQTKCISTAITNITYLVGGGGTSASITAGALPTGVTGTYNSGTKVFTISGTPSVAGTFNYTVGTAGPCINTSLSGTITVTPNATITLTSAGATTSQTVCQNSSITNITYSVGGSGTGANVTGLPSGVTGSYSAGVFTISGTPTTAVSGAFNYTVTTTGPCVTPNATGTITVNLIPTTTGVSVCQNGTGSLTSSFSCAAGSPVSTAARNAGTGASATGIGSVAWSNPGNITTTGTPYATAGLGGSATSNYLVGTNFGFTTGTVPANATIKGIQVTINRNGTQFIGTGITDQAVYLVKGGTVQSSATNKALGTTWSTSFSTASYGSTTDLWGVSLTAADVISTGFGVAIAAHNNISFTSETATVDYMQITITYSLPGSLNWYTASSGGSSIGSGSPFNPVGVLNSGLPTTANAGTTTFYAECSTVPGCRTPTDFVINALPTVSITGSNPICLDGTTTLSPTTGGTWISNSANATVSNAGVVTPVSAGSATFTFTESAHGCINTTSALTINANSTISLSSAAGTDAQTVCINTPMITTTYAIGGGGTGASITAGALPAGVTGSYSAGAFTISGTPTVNGSFNYTITTDGPCVNNSASGSITVTANATLSLTSAVGTDAQTVCNNTAITTVTYLAGSGATGASITSGSLPAGVTGAFSAGVFTISGTPTVAGSYSYTVTTSGGTCGQATASGTITVNAVATLAMTQTNVSQCVANNGTITITPSGGTGPYNYAWTGVIGSGNPATTPYPNPGNVNPVTNLTIGFYNVTVSDANGCSVSMSNIHVQYAYTVLITNSGSSSSGCGNTGSIILYGNAGVQPYTYSLDGITYQPGNTFTGLAAGTYTAYVKDASGCANTKSITVAAAAPIVVSPNPVASSSCSNDGSIQVFRSGGVGPYQYSLTSATGPWQASNLFTGLAAGPYTAYVKDVYGCTGQQSTTVNQGASLNVTVSKVNTSTCVNDGTIQVNVAGGVGPFTYSKNGGTTFQPGNSFGGLAAGNYPIVVKDAKGCSGSINVTINLNTINVTSFVTNATNCATSNGAIQLFRTGGVGPYTYSIDGNTYQASTMFTGLAAGTYDGYVKDSKTCVGVQVGIVVGPADCPTPLVGGPVTKTVKTMTVSNPGVKISEKSVLKISAYPNPSKEGFKLVLEGGSNEKISVIVTDLLGRKIYQSQADVLKQYSFGNDFKTGVYILQVIQGNDKQSIKLVKE